MFKTIIPICLSAFQSAINEILPDICVQRALLVEGNILRVNNMSYHIDKNVHLVAFGKAAPKMVEAAEKILGNTVFGGIASVPIGSGIRNPNDSAITFFEGAEDNLPDKKSMDNTNRIIQYLLSFRTCSQPQIFIFLISGGGSSLLCSPVSGLSLEEKLDVIRTLSSSGANICQLNAIRTALSNVKGGKLTRYAHPNKMISLILSDVIGDPINYIASGPTATLQKHENPIEIVKNLSLEKKLQPKILDLLKESSIQASNVPNVDNVNNIVIGNNRLMLSALANYFEKRGIKAFIISNDLEGDASLLGKSFAYFMQSSIRKNLLDFDALSRISSKIVLKSADVEAISKETKIVLLFGGESTVLFDSNMALTGGKGGRNQELVLSLFHSLLSDDFVNFFKSVGDTEFAFFSLGTDGQDGPTDATGAFATSECIRNYVEMKLPLEKEYLKKDLEHSLLGKDSYGFWSRYNCGFNLVKLGKTGTNVMDVQICYVKFSEE